MKGGSAIPRLRRLVRLRRILRMVRLYAAFLRDFLNSLFQPKLEHYAASLSFSTLFSIVPLLAIMISLFAVLPVSGRLRAAVEHLLRDSLPVGDPALIMGQLERFVANADQLGLLGIGWMALAAYFFSRTLDYIVQDICDAPQRGIAAALFTYGGLALLVPLLASIGYTVQAWLAALLRVLPQPPEPLASWMAAGLAWLLSLLLAWGIFWLFYQLAPNRRMAPGATATAAFIVALVWVLSRDAFLYYATHSSTYTTIYGVMATVILFLWWIYISWAILVHGLRFCMLLQQDGAGRRDTRD